MNKKHLFILCLLWALGIIAKADEIPNDEIWYTANSKLTVTTYVEISGIYIQAFNTTISSHTFSNGKGVINFEDDVTSIGYGAFSNCSSMTSITLPNSVTSIGHGAFDGCTSLPVVDNLRYADTYLVEPVDKTLSTYTIKEGTKGIGSSAFVNCTNLTSITIPNSVTSIGVCAFDGCTSLPIVDNLRYAGTYLIEAVDKTLSTYTIKEGTKWIGISAFSDCTGLTSVTIPNSVTSIENNAFRDCAGLISITIPKSVTGIGSSAFSGCSSLTSVTIPKSVTGIGSSAFSGCYSLTSVTIPKSVTGIGSYAFSGCSSLTSVTIPNSVTSIGNNAFEYCSNLKSITIPNSVKSIGNHSFSSCKFAQSEFINNSSLDAVANNYWGARIYDLIQDDGLCINGNVAVGYRGKPTSITIPKSVTSIGSSAFSGCSSLTSVTIPNSVTSIEWYAFKGCLGLTSVVIPNSVTSIGQSAFEKCSSLTYITIPNSVTSIGGSAFAYCSGLQSVKVSWSRPLSISSIFSGVDYSKCILYVPKGTATMYMVAPEWINFKNIQEYSDGEDAYYLTLKQGDAGNIQQEVEVGKCYNYKINATDGWVVNSVTFNGEDVTNKLNNGAYTTPVITASSVLSVVFQKSGTNVKDIAQSSVKVLAGNNVVTINGADADDDVLVYSLDGNLVTQSKGCGRIPLDNGVYVIKVGNDVFKVSI